MSSMTTHLFSFLSILEYCLFFAGLGAIPLAAIPLAVGSKKVGAKKVGAKKMGAFRIFVWVGFRRGHLPPCPLAAIPLAVGSKKVVAMKVVAMKVCPLPHVFCILVCEFFLIQVMPGYPNETLQSSPAF